jgi:hypothetical protein
MSEKMKVSSFRHHDRIEFDVAGVQDAGRQLSRTFRRLRNRRNARRLVEAIRHCNHHEVNRLLSRDCRAVCFFKKPGFDCVKIACGFGRRNSVIVSFDICVRSLHDRCGRGCGCGGYGGYGGGYGNGVF